MTTLTKAKLLELAANRCELVKGVPHFGDVWLRSCPEVQRSRRLSALFGKDGERQKALRRVHRIVDQVMASEHKPMFTDADVNTLMALDGAKLDPLFEAIVRFDEGTEGNG